MKKLFINLIFLIILSVSCAKKYVKEQPNFLTPCDLDDKKFSTCFAKNMENLLVHWKDGIPGILKTTLDPFAVKRIKIQQKTNNLEINAELKDIQVKGISRATFKDATFDNKTLISIATVTAPKLRFDVDYKGKGHVLALNINSQGKAFFELENVVIVFRSKYKLVDIDEFTFGEVDKFEAHIKNIGDLNFRIDNLFGGQKELEDSANELFKENWRQLYEVLAPTADKAIETILKDSLKQILNHLPANFILANVVKAKDYYG